MILFQHLPDGLDLLILLLQTAFSLMAELAEFRGQSLGALFLSFAALMETKEYEGKIIRHTNE